MVEHFPPGRRSARPVRPAPPGASMRADAARVVARVMFAGESLSDLLDETLPTDPAERRDRGFLRALVYGTLRGAARYGAMVRELLDDPGRLRDDTVLTLIMTGVHQLAAMRVPEHAAIASTVDAAGVLGKHWAVPLVNAALRRFQRERVEIEARCGDPCGEPDWLMEALRAAWPDDWQTIVTANAAQAPMTLRVARSPGRETYLERLRALGMGAQPGRHAAQAIVLDTPCDVWQLPDFDRGSVSVQDEAAQLATSLLDLAPGQRVLDACAAPGGKLLAIADAEPSLAALVAIEKDPARMERLKANTARARLRIQPKVGDAGRPGAWWDGKPFDRILLDAPCTGTGVIRRHPDIRFTRRATDPAQLAVEQARLLDALWPLLVRGGMLLYVTCSVLPEENERQVAAFLDRHADARALPIDVAWGRSTGAGRQILPGEDGMDGFYQARLTKP